MRNIKNTFMVSALSLGLIVGAVGVASAATSMDYQQKNADWVKNVPIPMVMNTNSGATPVTTPATVPAKTVTSAPVTTGQPNQNHYNDGHSNMNPQQHQQLHNTRRSKSANSMNGNGYNTNHNENHNTNMSGNHMSGSQSGHE